MSSSSLFQAPLQSGVLLVLENPILETNSHQDVSLPLTQAGCILKVEQVRRNFISQRHECRWWFRLQADQEECSFYIIVHCRNVFVFLPGLSALCCCLTFCSFIHRNLKEIVYLLLSCDLKGKLRSVPGQETGKRHKLGIFLSHILWHGVICGCREAGPPCYEQKTILVIQSPSHSKGYGQNYTSDSNCDKCFTKRIHRTWHCDFAASPMRKWG